MDIKGKSAAALLAATIVGGAGLGTIMATPMAAFAAESSTTAGSTARTPGQWITDSLKGLVDQGTITQEQSDAVAQTLEENRPARSEGGRGGYKGGGPGGNFHGNAEVAALLGLTQEELRSASATKSLADVARERNVDVQKVIDVLVAQHDTRIDQSFANGRLTQAEADEKKSGVVERVTEKVNSTRP